MKRGYVHWDEKQEPERKGGNLGWKGGARSGESEPSFPHYLALIAVMG